MQVKTLIFRNIRLVNFYLISGILFLTLSSNKSGYVSKNAFYLPTPGKSRLNMAEEIFQLRQDTSKKAEFPGGRKAVRDYLDDNFNVPKVAFKMKNKEVVISAQMELQIDTDGTASLLKLSELWVQPKDAAILQAVKTEITRFVAQMPKWTPATKNGQPVVATDTLSFIRSFAPNVTWEEYNSLKTKVRAERGNTPAAAGDLRTKDGKKVFTFIEKQPVFPGGDTTLKAYLLQNLKYLQLGHTARELVVLQIIVNEKGIAEDLKVVKPEGVTLTPQEVEAALKQMPVWNPGRQSGTPFPVSYIFAVRF